MKKKNPHAETIEAIDEVLTILREKYMNEKNEDGKLKIMNKIDKVLDERCRLMKLRDQHENA